MTLGDNHGSQTFWDSDCDLFCTMADIFTSLQKCDYCTFGPSTNKIKIEFDQDK